MVINNRQDNSLGINIVNLVTKYTSAGSFLDQMTEILRSVNQNPVMKPPQNFVQNLLRYPESSPETALNLSVFEKQVRMNAKTPTASGVISSPEPNKQNSI